MPSKQEKRAASQNKKKNREEINWKSVVWVSYYHQVKKGGKNKKFSNQITIIIIFQSIFLQVATRLKEILSSARTYQKNNVAKKKQANNSASGSSSWYCVPCWTKSNEWKIMNIGALEAFVWGIVGDIYWVVYNKIVWDCNCMLIMLHCHVIPPFSYVNDFYYVMLSKPFIL